MSTLFNIRKVQQCFVAMCKDLHLFSFTRYPVLSLYGNAGCVLHERYQHPGWDQWHRVRPGSLHLRVHHHLQHTGAKW